MNVYQNQHDTLVKSTETKYVSNQRRYDTNQQAIIRTSSLDSLCDRVTQDTGRFNLRTYLIPSFKSTAVVQHNSKQSISDRIRLPSFFETITRAADLSIKYQSEKFRKFAESSAGDINSMIQLPNLDIADSFWNSKPTGLNPQNCCIPERIDKMRFNSNCCNYLSDPPLSAPADVLAYYQRGQDHPFFFWDSINSDKTLRNDMADCGINVRQQDCQESSVKVRKQNEDLEYQNNYNSTIINNQESNDLIWTEIDENSCTEFQNRCNKQYAESEVINNYKAQIFVDENTASLPSELYGCNEVISGINSNSEMFTENFSFNELANKLDDKILTEFDKTDTAKHQLYTDKNKASTEKSSQKQNDILLDQKNNQISHKYSCNDCKKLFGSRSALAKHRLVHSKYRKYICHSCSKSFKRQDHLNGHVLTHLKTKPFLCKVPDCYKSYCDSRSLKRHIELKHQHVLADLLCGNNNAREYLPPIDAIYVNINANVHRICLQSNIMTSPDKDVFKKLSEMLSQSNDTALHFSFDEPKPIPCPSCNKSFKSMPALYGHMRLHRGYSNAINVIKLKTNYERNTSNPDAKSLFKEDINITLNSSTQKHTSSSGKQCTIDVEATSADRPKHIQKLKESNLLLNKMTPLFLSSYTVNSESSNEILSMVKDDQQCKEEKQVEKFRKHNRSKANCYMLSNDVRNMPTEPCINIGSKFQADIPEIDYGDSNDRETLLWTPRCITDKNICWQAVNDYLSFAQSAIHQKAPYSLELALYILCKCEGDMFSAMNVLLSGSIEIKANDSIFQTCLQDITLFPYSSSWTTKEIQQFLKTLQSVGTDFRTISEAVQTKSSKECVELYYLWKNLSIQMKNSKNKIT